MLPDEKITLRSRLGFIGLGHLGARIARRLVAEAQAQRAPKKRARA